MIAMTTIFGLVPALLLVRKQVASDLRSGERGSSRSVRRVYQGLVIAEVALACGLLVSSALLVRTVGQMTRVPLGVSSDDVTLANVQLAAVSSSEESWRTVGAHHTAILEHLREQPGVFSAGSANFMPMEHGWRGAAAARRSTDGATAGRAASPASLRQRRLSGDHGRNAAGRPLLHVPRYD